MINELLKRYYGLSVMSIEKSAVGAGSDTYFAECKNGKYVVKFPSESDINNPSAEPELCGFLLDRGINVSSFLKNTDGGFITSDDSGRIFHVQEFAEGTLYDWNTAPSWLLKASAETLGRIHSALKNYTDLPTGIGADFFKFMTPENALYSYENTLETARKNGDKEIEKDLLYRIELMKRFPDYSFDIDRLTCQGTHGDYFISQLICGDEDINAVIDWTTACVHPVVWEIVRSYVYAAPECADGEINISELAEYFRSYCKFSKLNDYDFQNALRLFYYQIAVCDYYNQYYTSDASNREIYLQQAFFSTRLLKWFENNIDTAEKKIGSQQQTVACQAMTTML
ncbi:MAG: phosphotransferase [Oscillospiraceae bacterium]|nr:phosphotransferase [Oscillospiraceae bacterium]